MKTTLPLTVVLVLLFTASAFAQFTITDIHDFDSNGTDGSGPQTAPVIDSSGNLFGTVQLGGANAEGIVYELSPSSNGWTENILFAFDKNNGDAAGPTGTPLFDAQGNIYGVTQFGGGSNNLGAVYELSPNGSGGYNQTVLHGFTGGSDGEFPVGSLIMDAAGNLYGTTTEGGGSTSSNCFAGCGIVFELSPDGSGGWTETILHVFSGGADGASPGGYLLFDSAGNLYGSAAQGGTVNSACFAGCGTIFKLSQVSGSWRFTLLFNFQGIAGGSSPEAIVFDSKGNLYGAANVGGSGCGTSGIGCGVIFKLTPSTTGGPWKEKVLHAFSNQSDGEQPAGVAFDFKGNLYGTCFLGSPGREGLVWELSPTTTGPWKFTQLHAFSKGVDGAQPNSGVIVDNKGNLFGTAPGGGFYGYGTMFELSPPATR